LIFIEGQKVFSRSIPIGGTTITSAIAKDFSESFIAAEQRKKSAGFVSLGGNYAEPTDPDVSRVSKVIRNTMTRLHAEISRSISFYRSQQQGSQPVRGYLCGGTTNLPYMCEFFHEKLNMPIEFFNPLRNVAVGSGVKLEEASKNAHILGELVGLSLREVSDCPMELSLRPQSVIRAQLIESKRPYILAAGVCVLLTLAGWWLFYFNTARIENSVLADRLNPQVADLQALEAKFEALRKEGKAAQENASPYLQAVEDRDYWLKVIDDINARLPDRFVWVTSFEPVENFGGGGGGQRGPGGGGPRGGGGGGPRGFSGVKIHGLYLDNPKQAEVVDDFVQNLAQSPLFSIDLSKRQEVNPVRSTPTATEWAYEYELHLNLKKPIGAQ
jgi:type IV pilus assembly protein PilM